MITPEKLSDEETKDFEVYMSKFSKLKKEEMIHVMSYWYLELLGAKNLCEAYAERNFAQETMHKVASAMKGANLRTCLDPTNFDYILSRESH